MRKLDRYLISQFLTKLVMTVVGFVAVILVVDLTENLDRLIDNQVPLNLILKYYFYALPWFLNIGLPMAMLISTVFTVGLMAKRNELTVLKSAGVSLYRIALPIFLIAVLISYASFELDNSLVSSGNQKRYQIERENMKHKSKRKYRNVLRNVFIQKEEATHIALNQYRVNQKTGKDVTILTLEEGILRRRLDAKKITWIDSLERWVTADFSIRDFDSRGEEVQVTLMKGDSLLILGFAPADITKRSKFPDEMNLAELTERIQQLKASGVDTTRWEVDRHFKIALAFTNLIIVVVGLPLVALKAKGGLTFGVGMGIFVIFVYYAFIKFGLSLGYKGVLDPLASAWLGNLVFSIGGVFLLIGVRK